MLDRDDHGADDSSGEAPADGAPADGGSSPFEATKGKGLVRLPDCRSLPFPRELHSTYEEGPFTRCSKCEGSLATSEYYEIQKVYRGRECIFELAICKACSSELSDEISSDSLHAMMGFLLGHFRPTCEPTHCHFCGFPRAAFQNFQVAACCETDTSSGKPSLILPGIVMCDKCSEGLQSLLSQKTKDTQNDFVNDNFPGVPADIDFVSPTFGPCF